ncbi:REP-associated tyrosine transposase [Taibaiella soli]|uniref:Transposase n=1 Tax=Taibaiella soli TaxID=1649169 RepID=A0A2W2AE32_9BACT|nr:transposase [Taibaiella soli]PZF71812.1 transposase [Taibaiella soli]
MSSRYKVSENDVPHFITTTVIHWIDALSRPLYKDIILDSLSFCQQKKGLQLHAWVIMNNHVHLIISAREGSQIADIVRDFKKFTSRKLIDAILNNAQESRRNWMMRMFRSAGTSNSSNEQFQFWEQNFHPIELDTEEKFRQRMNYLHENPVKAGFVWEAQQYKYSSATDYYERRPGLLPLIMIE